jgi:hypothetical protein
MIVPVTTRELLHRAYVLAQRTRRELAAAGVPPGDFAGIAHHYGLTLAWAPLPAHQPGCYLAAAKRIVLNPRGQGRERLNFTFHHELMHDRIEQDEEFLSLFADATPPADETTMERVCDAGAAELLMPGGDVQVMVQAHGFSPGTIPRLCRRYQASSIAVALQMLGTAPHVCYLVIAAPAGGEGARGRLLPGDPRGLAAPPPLRMLYTAASPAAKYSIKRGQPVPLDHPITAAWAQAGTVVRGQAPLPFASGRGRVVACEALAFRQKVFAFFHVPPWVRPG